MQSLAAPTTKILETIVRASHGPVLDLIVTTPRLGRFFEEMGTPLGGPRKPPSVEDLARLSELAAKYGYWNATPEQSAAVGIELPGTGR